MNDEDKVVISVAITKKMKEILDQKNINKSKDYREYVRRVHMNDYEDIDLELQKKKQQIEERKANKKEEELEINRLKTEIERLEKKKEQERKQAQKRENIKQFLKDNDKKDLQLSAIADRFNVSKHFIEEIRQEIINNGKINNQDVNNSEEINNIINNSDEINKDNVINNGEINKKNNISEKNNTKKNKESKKKQAVKELRKEFAMSNNKDEIDIQRISKEYEVSQEFLEKKLEVWK